MHGLGLDDTPFVCSANYSSGEESIDNIVRTATWRVAHHQIYAILNSITGDEGERTPRANRSRNVENSSSNDNSDYTITEEEWEISRAAITNNTRFPSGTSAGILNAYHTILERNRERLSNEQANLERRRRSADQSSERHRASHGSASRSNQGLGRHRLRVPRLLEEDARKITSNLSNFFMTMDTAGRNCQSRSLLDQPSADI
jgi:hypothetical protein